MDARILPQTATLLVLLLLTTGANYETANFVVDAPTAECARQVAETAEQCRHDLAILWLGNLLPDWQEKCPVKVLVGNTLGAGGKTSFIFENGNVFDWDMEIQGPYDKIIDSVLPHEITHMILASHFRKPIPRWLDEGLATSVEDKSEKENYRRMLRHFLQSDVQRCFPFNEMVAMKEYPSDAMPFYAQGFSTVEYLLEYGRQFDTNEHRRLVQFTQSAMHSGDWKSALQEHYDIQSLGDLQTSWIQWVGTDGRSLRTIAEVSVIAPPDLQTAEAEIPMGVTSAKLPPPIGKSVYEMEAIQPASFGRDVILR